MNKLRVTAFWDDEAKVFVAESADVPGLVAEAESPDALIRKLQVLIPELLDLNGYAHGEEIPFRLTFDDLEAVSHREAA
jgi:predicted RNase H-like HicB family nuclease